MGLAATMVKSLVSFLGKNALNQTVPNIKQARAMAADQVTLLVTTTAMETVPEMAVAMATCHPALSMIWTSETFLVRLTAAKVPIRYEQNANS